MPKRPGQTTVKTLFANSCNRCAYPACDEALTHREWRQVRADIAHIRGEKPGAARYDPEMTDDDRHAYDNLLLLCPNHHRMIDRLRPQDWPTEKLLELKDSHESGCGNKNWADPGELEFFTGLLMEMYAESETPSISSAAVERPRLVIQDGPGDSFLVVNISDFDAYNVRMELSESGRGNVVRLEDDAPRRLSPGAQWKAGLFVQTMGRSGQTIVRLEWENADGMKFDGEFPLS